MSLAGSQQRTFLALVAALRPHWRRDRHLPARIQSLLAGNRAFGSRDRRLYRELLYTTLRYLPWIERVLDRDPDEAARLVAWLAADAPATERFRSALLGDLPPCPSSIEAKARTAAEVFPSLHETCRADELLPDWFRADCPEAFTSDQIDALLARAPLWLRVQAHDVSAAAAEFAQLGWSVRPSPVLPTALHLQGEVDVTKTSASQK
ncbi:MAG TPA: hypothetical protein VEQ65_05015, partial [Opitutus sp.]|nr:hypothetical protein [Opitutus sp.]